MMEQVACTVAQVGKKAAVVAGTALAKTAKTAAVVTVKCGAKAVRTVVPKVAKCGVEAVKKAGGAAVRLSKPVMKKLAPLNTALLVISATMTALTVAGYFLTRDKDEK